MSQAGAEYVFIGRREEVGKMLQATFWSQLVLEVEVESEDWEG